MTLLRKHVHENIFKRGTMLTRRKIACVFEGGEADFQEGNA